MNNVKKSALTVLALCGMHGNVFAEEKLTVTASSQHRVENRVNDKNGTNLGNRVRVGFNIKTGNSVSLFAETQLVKSFGLTQLAPASTTANSDNITSGATFDPNVLFHQGYAQLNFQNGNLYIGRQRLSYGDDLLIGSLDWNMVGRSFDSIRYRWSLPQLGYVDFFWASLQSSSLQFTDQLWSAYSNLNINDSLKNLDLYFIHKSVGSVANGSFSTVGLRAKSNVGLADYRFESSFQFGNSFAFQALAELGYKLELEFNPRLSVEGFVSSKDYNQLFPTAHKFLGWADLFGRRNISGAIVNLSAAPVSDFTVGLSAFQFLRTDSSAPAYALNGTSAYGLGTETNSADLGRELDLWLEYKVSDQATLSMAYCYYMVGEYLTKVATSTNATVFNSTMNNSFAYVQLVTKI